MLELSGPCAVRGLVLISRHLHRAAWNRRSQWRRRSTPTRLTCPTKCCFIAATPLKHTSYNLFGGCEGVRSACFSFLFAVLRNSLISPQQWRRTEKSRSLLCEALRVSALFDSVFCGSLDAPPPSPCFYSKTASCPCIVRVCHYFPNQIFDLGGVLKGGWREDGEVYHRFETVKGLSLLAASQKATEPYGASGQSNYLFSTLVQPPPSRLSSPLSFS